MYPGHWATVKPDTIAVTNTATGDSYTWDELNDRSNQVAQLLTRCGLDQGDHVALIMDNQLAFFVIAWGVLRSGMYLTCINRYLTAEEAGYIVNDSESTALFTSDALEVTPQLLAHIPNCPNRFCTGHAPQGFQSFTEELAAMSISPIADERMGDSMLYSSGTTGRPKGIKRPLTGQPISDGIPGVNRANAYGIDEDTRYLSPAPLYHAAPFGYCMRTLSLGGSVFMMERFDEVQSLVNVEKYRITHSQWVPTMFVRMLKLPESDRTQFDLSSHKVAIHAAAPCPVAVKQQMMDWWGPILWEYYAGTERNGTTIINPQQWLAHPGSVGQAVSNPIRICNDEGFELPTGEAGTIYFEQPEKSFEYHNAPDKTSAATHPTEPNWTTLGDVGYLDEEGYLYLTDRKAFMIISGGVNIYPQEIEDALILHPDVQDIAVFGIPNPDFGEEVKAVIEPADRNADTTHLADTLAEYAREHLASYKVPRSFDFIDEMPRLPTGKLYKRLLKDKYWPAKT
ncbi:MAG: AMP-binding protein [Pseudomonadales bacterium]|nr:AMP-binding protein [Pseudomonadales bacterium]